MALEWVQRCVTRLRAGYPFTSSARCLSEPMHTVLLVEDEAGVRAVVARMLKRIGVAVVEACNAHEAMRLLKEQGGISLMLTNVVMPETSGFELADTARALRPGLKVVFMSGNAQEASAKYNLGPNIFIQKPFGVDQLRQTVLRILRPREEPEIAQ
jgi:DNA-binding NtrC family response regulator